MKIEHLVVLMMENRSFDHMLGHLKVTDPASPVNGLTGKETNPIPDPPGGVETVNFQAEYLTEIDPGHEYEDVVLQLFGQDEIPKPPVATSDGFVSSLARNRKSVNEGRTAMHCFDEPRIPALYTLAREFAICDNWFCSVPGPTWPNRFFVHAASSNGSVKHRIPNIVLGRYNQPVVYDQIRRKGLEWRLYFSDIAQAWALKRMQDTAMVRRCRTIGHFAADARNGDLPAYTFIEPRYFSFLRWKGNDQHPENHVALGDHLIAEVYEALRLSPLWEKILLVIIYDEHGGLYDHVSPPYDGAVVNGQPVSVKAPGGKHTKRPSFAFDRLGPRVPAVLVSPYIPRGTVDHTVYEHSSVPATLKKIFDLDGLLNERQRDANTFEKVLTSAFRGDTPRLLPRSPLDGRFAEYARHVLEDPDAETMTAYRAGGRAAADPADVDPEPLTDLQRDLMELAYSLDEPAPMRAMAPLRARLPHSETDAAAEVWRRVEQYRFGRGGMRPPPPREPEGETGIGAT